MHEELVALVLELVARVRNKGRLEILLFFFRFGIFGYNSYVWMYGLDKILSRYQKTYAFILN